MKWIIGQKNDRKNIWIAKTLPVDTWQILRAKLKLHNIITITPMIICSVILGIAFKLSILQIILVTVVPIIFVMLNGALGLIINRYIVGCKLV